MDEVRVKERLDTALKKDGRLYQFFQRLTVHSEVIFFGGCLRDLYFYDESDYKPRDYDVVLSTVNVEDNLIIEEIIKEYPYTKNQFGGYKVDINGTTVDLWFIENTYLFTKGVIEQSEVNLIKTVYLTIDAITFNYNRLKLNNQPFIETLDSGKIGITTRQVEKDDVNILRAIIFKNRYGLGLTQELRRLIKENYNENGTKFINNMTELRELRYPDEALTYDKLLEEVKETIKGLTKNKG